MMWESCLVYAVRSEVLRAVYDGQQLDLTELLSEFCEYFN